MKRMTKLLALLVIGVLGMTVASCGSKVNEADLDKKLESLNMEAILDGDGVSQLNKITGDEYEYMVDRILEVEDSQDLNDPKVEKALGYLVYVTIAHQKGVLKGDAKDKWANSKIVQHVEETRKATEEILRNYKENEQSYQEYYDSDEYDNY